MSKRTHPAWRVNPPSANRPWTEVLSGGQENGYVVARFLLESDAAHVVRCVNTHAQLVEALEAICANGGTATNAMLISARVALAAARGEGT